MSTPRHCEASAEMIRITSTETTGTTENESKGSYRLAMCGVVPAVLFFLLLEYATWSPYPLRVGPYVLIGPMWGYQPGFGTHSTDRRAQRRELASMPYTGNWYDLLLDRPANRLPAVPALPKPVFDTNEWSLFKDPSGLIRTEGPLSGEP